MKEKRKYPRGLCPTCLFRYRCKYATEHSDESVMVCDNKTGLSYMKDSSAKPEKHGTVKAYIVRDARGVCRIYCQRDRRKWWFELGQHRETDNAFEQALAFGYVRWEPKIQDRTKLF